MEPRSLDGLTAALEQTLTSIAETGEVPVGSLRATPTQALRLEEGELPESIGRTRLVMLVVDPYLVHAYWEVTPERLAEAGETAGDSARSVLRFYETPDGAAGGDPQAGWFDVDADLQSRNWYVPLWSAGRTYRTDLGLKSDDGRFVALASSNVIHTPRAWPVSEVDEHFMQAETPPPQVESAAPPGVQAGGTAAQETPKAPDSTQTLRKKLEEFHALRDSGHEPPQREAPLPEATPSTGREQAGVDLTATAETRFIPGISSQTVRRSGPQ